MKRFGIPVITFLIVIGILVALFSSGSLQFSNSSSPTPVVPTAATVSMPSTASPAATLIDPSNLAGLETGNVPWNPETNHLKQRLSQIGLPALSQEGTALHIHEHLDIYIHGKKSPVPEGIGIDEKAGFISPIHTHDTSGIIHVESPIVQDFTLGQFFDIWGVRLSDTCIGGYCNTGNNVLKIYSNGKPVDKDFRELVLGKLQEIVIVYGADSEVPSPIPSTYTFPEGY